MIVICITTFGHRESKQRVWTGLASQSLANLPCSMPVGLDFLELRANRALAFLAVLNTIFLRIVLIVQFWNNAGIRRMAQMPFVRTGGSSL